MRLGDQSRANVEDRRGRGLRLGLGGFVIVLALSVITGRNLFDELDGGEAPAVDDPGRRDREVELERVAVGTFNDGQRVFRETIGDQYQDAKLVLFWDEVLSACGGASAAMGPFYCPGDTRVYIDLGFYEELSKRFGAPGDFAQAYVIAHELGHHMQNLLGIEKEVRRGQREDPDRENELSVRMELQADCFAGVWGHSAKSRAMLEKGDVEEAMKAAQAIGDDRLQEMAGQRVQPESFTHGTSKQRAKWFRRGLQSGSLDDCDTFAQEP